MGHTHIITILEDGFISHMRNDGRNTDDLCLELGKKIASLCKTRGISGEPPIDLGGVSGAIAWRGYPSGAHDELFYWGADLKSLEELSDKQLALAEKFLKREKDRRGSRPTK